MKYAPGILFILGISLVGFNGAFADSQYNLDNIDTGNPDHYVDATFDRETSEFVIDYNFDAQECVTYADVLPGGMAFFPNDSTLANGEIISYGRINAEKIDCTGTLNIPIEKFYGQEAFLVRMAFFEIQNGGWTYQSKLHDLYITYSANEFDSYQRYKCNFDVNLFVDGTSEVTLLSTNLGPYRPHPCITPPPIDVIAELEDLNVEVSILRTYCTATDTSFLVLNNKPTYVGGQPIVITGQMSPISADSKVTWLVLLTGTVQDDRFVKVGKAPIDPITGKFEIVIPHLFKDVSGNDVILPSGYYQLGYQVLLPSGLKDQVTLVYFTVLSPE